MPSFNKPTKKPKYGRRILFLLVIIILRRSFAKNVTLDQKIVIMKGDSISTILKPLSSWDKTRIKLYIKMHSVNLSKLEPGTYDFT
jgi:3'-phosphoadenosine 5'-phosphosulfate sulfotransferase (PAPS reductase)/FAD synthetase